MIIAAIVIVANPSPYRSKAQISLAAEMTLFSFLAVLLLHTLNSVAFTSPKRSTGRSAIFILILVLFVVEGNWAPISAANATGQAWEQACGGTIFVKAVRTNFILLMIYTGFWVTWLLFFYIFPRTLKSTFPSAVSWVNAKSKYTNLAAFGFLFPIMWGHLINVTVSRHQILNGTNFNTEDTQWTFGQVVALGTWLPVVVELYYLLRRKFLSNNLNII